MQDHCRCNLRKVLGLWFLMVHGSLLWAASALPDAFSVEALLWERRLGIHQYTIPVVYQSRLYLGVDDKALDHPVVRSSGGGVLLCLQPETSELLWQMPIPRNMSGKKPPFHFNHWKCGVCSQPAFDGNRLYIVGPRGDVLCLDQAGQSNGNDGPFRNERDYMQVPSDSDYTLTRTDGDIVWRYDLIAESQVVPHDVCGSSPLIHGDFLYACTGNGQDHKHETIASPEAPSLVVLDKRTGALVATEGKLFGQRLLHGNWSSPRAARFGDQELVLFSGGDGVLYAFQPIDERRDKVQTLSILWQYDCNPPEYRMQDGTPIPCSKWNKKRADGPSELLASPVVHNNRVYVAIGQSPLHGPGQGQLCCVDGVTGALVWATRRLDRTLSDIVIHEGLLYAADFSGQLFCMEADTGKILWTHDLEAGVWSASPVVVEDRVIISNEKQTLWVFQAGRAKKVLSRSRTKSMAITPAVYGDTLYFSTQKRLFALKRDGFSS